MRPEKATGRIPWGKKDGPAGEACCSLSEAAGFPLEHREKRTFCLFFCGGRRGERVVGWTGVFVAIQKDFLEATFLGIFFVQKKQKSSTNSFWQKFGQATWTESFVFGAPRSLPPPQEVCPKKNPKQRRWDRSKRCPMGAIIAPW